MVDRPSKMVAFRSLVAGLIGAEPALGCLGHVLGPACDQSKAQPGTGIVCMSGSCRPKDHPGAPPALTRHRKALARSCAPRP